MIGKIEININLDDLIEVENDQNALHFPFKIPLKMTQIVDKMQKNRSKWI